MTIKLAIYNADAHKLRSVRPILDQSTISPLHSKFTPNLRVLELPCRQCYIDH